MLAGIDEGNGYGPSNIQAGPPFTTFFRDVVHGLGISDDNFLATGVSIGVCATGGQVVLSPYNENTWSTVSLNTEVPDTPTTLGFHSFTSNVLWATNTDPRRNSTRPGSTDTSY